MLARADQRRIRRHAEHQGVVVAVVAALDLDDDVAAGGGAHQARGLQRRLGAGVAEAPERQPEAFDQVLPDRVQVLRGLREVRAARGLLAGSPRRSWGARGRPPWRRSPGGSRCTRCRRCPTAGCPARGRCRWRAAASPASSRRPRRRRFSLGGGTRYSIEARCLGSSAASSCAIRASKSSRSNAVVLRTAIVEPASWATDALNDRSKL